MRFQYLLASALLLATTVNASYLARRGTRGFHGKSPHRATSQDRRLMSMGKSKNKSRAEPTTTEPFEADLVTTTPTTAPTSAPTAAPTKAPVVADIPAGGSAADVPTLGPSAIPTLAPSALPSLVPSEVPSLVPSEVPSLVPSDELPIGASQTSDVPSLAPSASPEPSGAPSDVPSLAPSASPKPSGAPSDVPSQAPTELEESIFYVTFSN